MNNIRTPVIVNVVFGGIVGAFFIRGRSDKYAVMGKSKAIQFSHSFINKLENKKRKFGGSTL